MSTCGMLIAGVSGVRCQVEVPRVLRCVGVHVKSVLTRDRDLGMYKIKYIKSKSFQSPRLSMVLAHKLYTLQPPTTDCAPAPDDIPRYSSTPYTSLTHTHHLYRRHRPQYSIPLVQCPRNPSLKDPGRRKCSCYYLVSTQTRH